MKACTILATLALAGSALAGGTSGSGLVVLDQSASGALTMVGHSSVYIPARAVYVNSSDANAIRTSGSATLDVPNLYVCGGWSFSGSSSCTGVITRSSVPYVDPCCGLRIPNAAGQVDLGSVSVSSTAPRVFNPGYYSGGISISANADITFNPGVYLLGGNGLRVNTGNITASGVCFVMLSGSLNIQGCSSFNLTPSIAGDLANVVIVQPSGNNADMSLSGGSNMFIAGTIYASGATINLTGTSAVQGTGPQMGDLVVGKKVYLAGTSMIRIGCPDCMAIELPKLPLFD